MCGVCGAVRVDHQIGLEETLEEFIEKIVQVFREVRRVLRRDGTLWLNLGDAYAGSWSGTSIRPEGGAQREGEPGFQKLDDGRYPARGGNVPIGLKPKDLIGMPWRVALALQADGWWLRRDIIWAKPNPMPESVYDRPTTAHEYVFLLSKAERYFYDAEAVREKTTGFANSRGQGMNPKATKPSSGWDKSVGEGGHGTIHKRPRQNASFTEAISRSPELVLESRNLRSVWSIATEPCPEAHFATFPTKLVEPCILAGTSEQGGCLTCGAPRVREVEVEYDNPGNRQTNGDRSKERKHQEFGTAGYDQRLERRSRTTGWKPSCKCSFPQLTRPCVVLDPFMGSGTTALVALRARRDFVGIELNPSYAEIARRRIEPELSQLKLC